MKRFDSLKFAAAGIAMLGVTSLGASNALAIEDTATVDVTIVSPLSVTIIATMNWGIITAPGTGTHTYAMASDGIVTIASDSGDGTAQLINASGSAATFDIVSQVNSVVSLTATTTPFGVANIRFSALEITDPAGDHATVSGTQVLNSGPATGSIPLGGSVNVRVIGEIEIDAGATTNTAATIVLSANYQ